MHTTSKIKGFVFAKLVHLPRCLELPGKRCLPLRTEPSTFSLH
jgi:hypothetical protein